MDTTIFSFFLAFSFRWQLQFFKAIFKWLVKQEEDERREKKKMEEEKEVKEEDSPAYLFWYKNCLKKIECIATKTLKLMKK